MIPEQEVAMKVAFHHYEPSASPFILAMEVFDLDEAGRLHRENRTFSLNLGDAYFDGELVVVPVDGISSVDDIQDLARVPISFYEDNGETNE